ncbi:MAG: asparagine synthase (glutamine-hydrolyzing) [Bacteroidetes bacterium]|nr:asparagine synthase (glutamine-hydrolyzing) [Bacteroidota bacterium]
MCGIAGFVDEKGRLDRGQLSAMGLAMAHRGPDAEGIWHEGPAGFLHRRLSILDLSDSANQPMHSADGRYVMVFNGEIYNYRQIARDLALQDLRTTGDSEVILEAFARLGPDFVYRLNGMFSIAIWDKARQELHLFRDHIGIKPLYYSLDQDRLVFASELKALLQIPGLRDRSELNPAALNAFLHLSYIPGELSIYEGIRKLLPGHKALYKGGKLHLTRYWNIEDTIHTNPSPTEAVAVEQLHPLLRDSVASQMIADVPLGTFLSGGIDSSLVTALAAEASPHRVRTFSIGFKESKFNEAHYARHVAEHLRTDHTEFVLSEEEAQSRFEDILATYDEPFGDSSAIPTMLVSELARKEVTVILSGDGGDETHLGYGSYAWADRLEQPIYRGLHNPLALALEHTPGLPDRYRRIGKLLHYPDQTHLPSHIFSQEQYAFSRAELRSLVKQPFHADFALPEFPERSYLHLTAAERQALFDLKRYLPDDLLVKVDRASMRSSLEVRVPLLDHRLVSYALNLPAALRSHNGVSKRLLKQILYQYVPASVFARPKWGFGIPLGDWLKGQWKERIPQYLNKDLVEEAGLVHFSEVERLLKLFARGHSHLYVRIWLLLLLHKWYAEKFR